jgi:purine-cytosine permease-like protein
MASGDPRRPGGGATSTAAVTPTQEVPGAWTIERRGIDHVPDVQRWGRPTGLFWLWAGAIFNIEFLVYGTLAIVSFGLSFTQAAVVIVVANASYVLTGLASLQGPQAGTTVFTISRAPFGPNGNRVVALFNWVTQVGFETEGVALVVLAGLALAHQAGVHEGTAFKVGMIVAAAGVQLLLPLLGHATIWKVLTYLALPFMALFVILAILASSRVRLGPIPGHPGASWEMMLVAAALVIAAGGLGWTENANDYSRYLPRDASKAGILWWVFLGCFLPSVLLELLGAAVATGFVTSKVAISDPISGLPHAFPGWFLVPYLVVAIVQLFAINTLDLYSSGVTLQSIGLRLRCARG